MPSAKGAGTRPHSADLKMYPRTLELPEPSTASTFDLRLGYRGELMSDSLIYLRARNYQPYTGEFSSRDQMPGRIGSTVLANVYHYVDNAPLMRIDPTGMYSVTDLTIADDRPRSDAATRESRGTILLFDPPPAFSDEASRVRLSEEYRGHGDTFHGAALEAGIDEFYLLAIYHKEGYAYNRAIPGGGAGQAAVDDINNARQSLQDAAKAGVCALPFVSCGPLRPGTRRGAFGLHEEDIGSAIDTALAHGGSLGRSDVFNDISGNFALDVRFAAWHFQTLRDAARAEAARRGIPVASNVPASKGLLAEYSINDLASGSWLRGHTFVGLIDYWTQGVSLSTADREGENYMRTIRRLRRSYASA